MGHNLDEVVNLLRSGVITIEYDNNDLEGLNQILIQSFNQNIAKGLNKYYTKHLNSWCGDITPKVRVVKLSEIDIYRYEDNN